MRSIKIFAKLLLSLALCVASVLPAAEAERVSAQDGQGHIVRVGIYVNTTTDSRVFSARTESETGFEIGVSSGNVFQKLFVIGNKTVYILPQTNASFDAETGKCVPDENGNIGAYSSLLAVYSSYSEASARAKTANGFVAVTENGYEVRTNRSSSPLQGASAKEPCSGGIMLLDESGRTLITFEDGARVFALRAISGGAVSFPVAHRSGAVNTYEYTGFFEYSVSSGKLSMINCIPIEDYTKCVMSGEIGTNVSTETRKAFSILARTVPLGKKHISDGFDVCCNSACCQVYRGLDNMSEENNAIVDSTRGLYCAYNGSPISVLYHNSNGGASCSSVAAWGGDEVPYLTTVFLDEDGESDVWERVFTKDEFFKYITSRRAFSAIGDADITMKIIEKDPYGSDYVTVLSVSDGSGNEIELRTSESIRSACGFESANFSLEYSNEVTVLTADGTTEEKTITGVLTADGFKEFDGFSQSVTTTSGENVGAQKIVISGEGAGHGVGFSATGSEKLAADGYSYEYILGFFFNGTTLKKLG